MFFASPIRALCPPNLRHKTSWREHIVNMYFCSFLRHLITSFLLGPNNLLSMLPSITVHLLLRTKFNHSHFSLNMPCIINTVSYSTFDSIVIWYKPDGKPLLPFSLLLEASTRKQTYAEVSGASLWLRHMTSFSTLRLNWPCLSTGAWKAALLYETSWNRTILCTRLHHHCSFGTVWTLQRRYFISSNLHR